MTTPNQADLTLYTFAMSHYSEKIRWALDHSQLPYREVCMSPVFHMLPALRLGQRGQTTLPILQTQGMAIQDSPRILDWLIDQGDPKDLLPASHRQEIRDVEQRFDAIGKDVARFLYANSFGSADEHILALWTAFATPLQARVLTRGYPLIRWAFKRKLRITPQRAALARQRITDAINWLESRLPDGRGYLVHNRFSAADITAAALLAPIACPAQHPVYGDPTFAHSMDAAITPWRNRVALQWVRRMYEQHRGDFHGGVFSQQPHRHTA